METLNLVAGIGLAVAVVGERWRSSRHCSCRRAGERLADDPWDGHTLEWATTSPPPVGNFATVPEVTSEAPLYDARYAGASVRAAESTEASA